MMQVGINWATTPQTVEQKYKRSWPRFLISISISFLFAAIFNAWLGERHRAKIKQLDGDIRLVAAMQEEAMKVLTAATNHADAPTNWVGLWVTNSVPPPTNHYDWLTNSGPIFWQFEEPLVLTNKPGLKKGGPMEFYRFQPAPKLRRYWFEQALPEPRIDI